MQLWGNQIEKPVEEKAPTSKSVATTEALIPDISWYNPELNFTEAQTNYINIIKSTFRIWDAFGRPQDYAPVIYQQEYHSKFFLCLPREEWKDRIVRKGRGIGFTMCTMIDMIMACLAYDGITIPVVSHREQEARRLVHMAQKLIDIAKMDLGTTKKKVGQVNFSNGSQILPFPAGSVNAIRSNRSPVLFYDEMEFYGHPDELLAAGDDIMSEGGQKTIGSTCESRNSLFWLLSERAASNKLDWYYWDLPVFDREKFLREKSIIEQVKEGELFPLGWWYDLEKMEDRRQRDVITFMQENMCIPADEGSSFLGWDNIINAMDINLEMGTPGKSQQNRFRTLGVDFARSVDQSAWAIFEWMPVHEGFIKTQVWFEQFTGVSTPNQIEYGASLIEEWDIDSVRVDMTGNGLGLFEGLEDRFGVMVEGFNASKTMHAGADDIYVTNDIEGEVIAEYRRKYRDEKTKVRTNWKLATGLKTQLQNGMLKLIYSELQAEQMNAVDHQLKAPHTKYGHSDIFWATALAVFEQKGVGTQIFKVGELKPWEETEERPTNLSDEEYTQIKEIMEVNKELRKEGVAI